MSLQAMRQWVWLIAVTLVFSFCLLPVSGSLAQSTLTPDVKNALTRFTAGKYTDPAQRARDQAKLFANNDAINAARTNNEIANSVYQTAQSDFDTLNTKFGHGAATDAKAGFTVQQRPAGATFSPGTDSDYITVVGNKNQIGTMQSNYNRRVNDFLTKNGAIKKPRTNWHNKLDTDFMADPRLVSSEADFRDIAKMNNDAYKRRASAEFERISRTKGGGKIGPQHVTAYTDDMADFTAKKGDKISDMFKNPSLFNDPKNRAKVMTMMAQEQKYISRMEALDNFVRKQEGLPPRNRGKSIAKQGSIRDPSNVKGIKDAHKVAKASQGQAISDLAETMGEVAKKNPNGAFAKSSADDIARIMARAPAEHRAAAMARLNRTNPALAKAVKGSPKFSAADGLARAGDKITDAARAADKLGDASKVGRMRKGLTAAAKAMEALGKIGTAADVIAAASQLKDYLGVMNKALDPNISEEEAAVLAKKAAAMAKDLLKSSTLIAAMERHPTIAVIVGTWTISFEGTSWILSNTKTGQSINRAAGEYIKRHVGAWDNMVDSVTGKKAEREAQKKAICEKFKTAVREGRAKVKWPYDANDVCNAMKRGEKIANMLEGATGPKSTAQLCANLEGRISAATALVDKGDLAAAQGQLSAARLKLANAGTQACAGLDGRIAGQLSRITALTAVQMAKAEAALSKCQFKESQQIIGNLPQGGGRQALTARWNKALETESKARDLIQQAKAPEGQGEIGKATAKLGEARKLNPCPATIAAINEAINRIAQRGIATAQAALAACQFKNSRDLIGKLPESSRAPLAARWNTAYEKEGNARDLVVQAKALENQGEHGSAIATLRQARNLGPCQSTIAAIDQAISRIQQAIARAVSDAEAALAACQFKKSRQLIGKLPEGSRGSLVARWNKAYETEGKARDLVIQAKALENDGKPGRAIGKLHQARDLPPCESTISVIDKAISRIRQGANEEKKEQSIADANDRCRNKHGSGYYAGAIDGDGSFYCIPNETVANTWCRDNNEGSGWTSGNINGDGSFDCNQSTGGQRADAVANCREEYGDRLIRVVRSGGKWQCEYKTAIAVAEEDCREQQRQHGKRLIRVYQSGSQWYCEWQEGETRQTGGGTSGGGRRACPELYVDYGSGCTHIMSDVGRILQGIGR